MPQFWQPLRYRPKSVAQTGNRLPSQYYFEKSISDPGIHLGVPLGFRPNFKKQCLWATTKSAFQALGEPLSLALAQRIPDN